MNETQIKNFVIAEVEASVARHFGVIKEWLADYFAVASENTELLREQILRTQEYADDSLVPLQTTAGVLAVEIVGIQANIKTLEAEVVSLNTHAGRLELPDKNKKD